MRRYNPKEIEPSWQEVWTKSKIYEAKPDKSKPKKYILEYFPYPSGAAMHVGHVRNYTIGDTMSRFNRMKGFNVLHPMGWDAFGLPAENYAIKTGVSPRQAIDHNTARFKEQLVQMGFSYDWSREIDSTDPAYYKWTQWFFIMLFNKGLAYQKESLQWWCPVDKTVLANEQVEEGHCWRCGSLVEKKSLKQWFFKITDYANRLDKDLEKLNWSDAIKAMQHNWIGKSIGAEINFEVEADLTGVDFVFLHGYKGSPDRDFFPWLREVIEERGGKVYAPSLPNPQEPKIDEQVDYLINNYDFSESTQIVSHSLGGVVAMKLLAKLQTKISKLTMVAPPIRTEFLDNKKRPALEAACDWTFDFEAVKQKVNNQVQVLGDTHDDIVPITHPEEIARQLNANLIATKANTPHFNSAKEESISEAILPAITVFTTRVDTLFGATFMVLAPENPIIESIVTAEQKQQVNTYISQSVNRSDIERQETDREKTGVFTGAYAINPATKKRIPIWVADYVLSGYGTGAIMAVPAHDERDWEFAKKHQLPIIQVFDNQHKESAEWYAGEGKLKNSGQYDGLTTSEAREKMTKAYGAERVNYKLRDWLISRQRYWGAPIPMIHCAKCGTVPVPDKDLPVVLPDVKSYEPSGDGRSPLANVPEFVNVNCPNCGGKAERETDTMDGFACSSWYFLRFADPHNHKQPFSKELAREWLPVDDYIGGAEHAVMHLLYARFWTKVMFDDGLISFDEPFSTLRNHGMILAPDGQKMSKSKGNTIEPDTLLEQGYGADSIRIMELFIGPWNQAANWSVEGMGGAYRFLNRVWTLAYEFMEAKTSEQDHVSEVALATITHKTIKKVTKDIEVMSYNTAIASMMSLVNELYKIKGEKTIIKSAAWRTTIESLLQLLAPFAPHITEELWSELGHEESIHISAWPSWDEKLIVEDTMTLAIQINGKLRGEIEVETDADETSILEQVKNEPKIKTLISGKEIKKEIYVPGRLVSLVVV